MLLMVAAICVTPLWNLLRRGLPAGIWEKLQSPNRVEYSHMKRTIVNVYLFCYAPATQSALEMLICKDLAETCDNENPELCVSVLAIDYSIECAGPEYFAARVTAIFTLAMVVAVLPIGLLSYGKKVVEKRQFDMELRFHDVKLWFTELDVDISGTLDPVEIHQLLRRMRMRTNVKTFKKTIMEFAKIAITERVEKQEAADNRFLTALQQQAAAKAEFKQERQDDDDDVRRRRRESVGVQADAIRDLRTRQPVSLSTWADAKSEKQLNLEKFLKEAAREALADFNETHQRANRHANHDVSDLEVTEISVSPEQFNKWYLIKCREMVSSPVDVLFGTVHNRSYWWFAQVLWLKFAINVLYSFGKEFGVCS